MQKLVEADTAVLERKMCEVLGTRIFTQRTHLRMTQEELAQKCGVTAGAISHIEQGKNFPTLPLVIRIAKALSYKSADDLLEGFI